MTEQGCFFDTRAPDRKLRTGISQRGSWPQDDLADASGISKPTIGRLEATDSNDLIGGRVETGEALVAALEKAGIDFIAENRGGAGVRLRKRAGRR